MNFLRENPELRFGSRHFWIQHTRKPPDANFYASIRKCTPNSHIRPTSIHIDDLVSEKFQIKRGVRQGDPISPKLFSAAIETIFQTVDLDKGLNIDGETLTNLRFADDVALTTNNMTEMEEQLNRLNKNSKNIGLKMHKGKTKYMTNFQNDQEIHIESEKIEEVTNYKYLGQTTYLKDTTKEEVTCRIRAGWSCFRKNRDIFQDD